MISQAMAPVDPMRPELFVLRRISAETKDTFTIELESEDGRGGFSFSPGQFNMLYFFGVGEVPISISGDPGKPRRLVHTIRAVGSVTRAFQKLKRGGTVGVRGPYGTHWPIEEAAGNDVVIVAGGIGLAPLRPALYSLLANRDRYGKVILLYGARSPEELLYEREVTQWRGRFDMQVEVTVDIGTRGWRGHVGVVTTLIPKSSLDPDNTTVMICGPEVMMRFTLMELRKRGVPPENLFISMERNMKCAVGFCGHCQLGPTFICKDGPVFPFLKMQPFFGKREI